MSNAKNVLKKLKVINYPSNKMLSLCSHMNYDVFKFTTDLYELLGETKLIDFAEQALIKLRDESGSIYVDLGDGEYIAGEVDILHYSDDMEAITCGLIWTGGEVSNGDDGTITIFDIIDDSDGDFTSTSDALDHYRGEFEHYLLKMTGLRFDLD